VLTFKNVEDTIGTFDGESAKTIDEWIASFENAAKLCNRNDIQKMIYAEKLLRGSAKIFVQRRVRAEIWKDLKTALAEEFTQEVSAFQAHDEPRKRTKRRNES